MTDLTQVPADDGTGRTRRAVIAGLERIDPEFVLHLPSSTPDGRIFDHFLTGDGARPNRRIFPIPREEEGKFMAWLEKRE